MDLQDEFEHTLKEISEELDIPKETCRQVLLVALKKLKNSKYSDRWKIIEETIKEIENANYSQ